jgi:hypothetical protein
MTAYKCLTAEGTGRFSGFAWPLPDGRPGAWVEAEVVPCRSGIHACRPADLPYWLAPTLYEIELGELVDEQETKVVSRRGRLVRRVEAWDEARDAYGQMCVSRADELATEAPERVGDWAPTSAIALSESARLGFVAARIAEELGGVDAYLDERRRQTAWLVDRLALG